MAVRLELSHEGFDTILKLSPFHPTACLDGDGFLRIGYNHLVWTAHVPARGERALQTASRIFPKPLTRAQAEHILQSDILSAAATIRQYIRAHLKQNEFDALVSLLVDVGKGCPGVKDGLVWSSRGERAPIPGLIESGDRFGAADAMLMYARGGDDFMRSFSRRAAERATFLYSRRGEKCFVTT